MWLLVKLAFGTEEIDPSKSRYLLTNVCSSTDLWTIDQSPYLLAKSTFEKWMSGHFKKIFCEWAPELTSRARQSFCLIENIRNYLENPLKRRLPQFCHSLSKEYFQIAQKLKKIETKSNVRPLQSVSIQIDELRPGIKMTGGPCRHVVGYEKRKKKRPEPRATIRSCASTWSKEANMRKLKREVDDKVTPTKRRSTQRSGTTVTDQEKA